MLYFYMTEQCRREAGAPGINKLEEVEALRKKLTSQQNILGLKRYPPPFLERRFGVTRLIIAEVPINKGKDIVYCFLRHVHRDDINNYRSYLETINVPENDDPDLRNFLGEANSASHAPLIERKEPSKLELEYITVRDQEEGQIRVLESPSWTKAMRAMQDSLSERILLGDVLELLHNIFEGIEKNPTMTEREDPHNKIRVLYRYFPDNNAVLLVALLKEQEDPTEIQCAQECLKNSANFDETQLLQNADRAYPDFILYDKNSWASVQANMDANLALSPEESGILSNMLNPESDEGFPLFINGRPGSGKSTILQYLFADYLHAHLARPTDQRLPHPPLYLTYNEQLLERARNLVEKIFRCSARKLALAEKDHVNLNDEKKREEFDSAFACFREFLLSLLGDNKFDREKYMDFRRFRVRYNKRSQGSAELRQLSPEVAWHTVRTYIKGKMLSEAEFFDLENYEELPRDEITVKTETFELVWKNVWDRWYRKLCKDEGYWDDQDLARHVLDQDIVLSRYPVVFCDEAQDFTSVELELIFRLSLFSTKRIAHHYLKRIPYAFAGDPFQTLNPTGFRWDAIQANFYNNIARQLAPGQHVDFTFKELAYNYRSTKNIVHFCNLIQLKRAELFKINDVSPQKAWTPDEGTHTAYYFKLDLSTQKQLREQSESVIIIPCQEGEEKSFIEQDEYLKEIALDKGEIVRNVLSPMQAKGLEFSRVVLYKFGSQAVSDEHVDTMERIKAAGDAHLDREYTLGLEYFFNGVYVGASRARRKLLVVDTEDGLAKFWHFATDGKEITNLLKAHEGTEWTNESSSIEGTMALGDLSSWSEGRDDSKELADKFFNQGKSERSIHYLQLARINYKRVGDETSVKLCTALIHDFECRYRQAADTYKKLDNYLDEAIRCYWDAKAYSEIIETYNRNQKSIGRTPFILAAQFMCGELTINSAAQFITDLTRIEKTIRQARFKYQHWPKVIQKVICILVGDPSKRAPLDPQTTKKIYSKLHKMCREEGLKPDDTLELAQLAFNARALKDALKVWGNVAWPTSKREPAFILRARGETDDYPQNLQWYAQLKDNKQIVEEHKKNPSKELEEEHRRIIVNAAVDLKDYQTPVNLVKDSSWDSMQYCLKKLPISREGKEAARLLLGFYLQKGLEEGKFKEVINCIKPENTDITFPASLLSDEQNLVVIEAFLIKLLARSGKFADGNSGKKSVFKTIIERRKTNKLKKLVSPEEIGAALEKAGHIDDALAFYESIFYKEQKRWKTDTIENVKKRYLRCKMCKAGLENIPKDITQLPPEIKALRSDWGLEIPEEEVPVIRGFESNEIDTLLEKISISADTQRTVDRDKQKYQNENGQKRRLPDSLPPSRPATTNRIELSFKSGGIDLEAQLFPKKRRLELRSKPYYNLVTIDVANNEVFTDDVQLTSLDDTTWRIEEWSLNISLRDVTEDMALIDLFDHDERRILCLLN